MGTLDLGIIVVVQVITFLLLVLLLRRIMHSATANELKRLRDLNLENEKKAEKLAKDLERAEREYERKVARTEAELKSLRAKVREESEKQKEQTLRKAREEGDKIVSQALNVKERIREELEEEMTERSVRFACELIKDVLTAENMTWFHNGLVTDLVAAADKLDGSPFDGIKPGAKAEVRTPYELSGEQLSRLNGALSDRCRQTIQLAQVPDRDVIAGIRITVGSMEIDGSLAGKLRQMAERINQR
jgi:F-type H+-transporting ATPase subunit b